MAHYMYANFVCLQEGGLPVSTKFVMKCKKSCALGEVFGMNLVFCLKEGDL